MLQPVVGECGGPVWPVVMRCLFAVGLLLGVPSESLAAEPEARACSKDEADAGGPAQTAKDPEKAAQRCAVAWTLTSLRVAERELVFALCMLGETEDGNLAAQGDDSKKRIERLVARASRVAVRNPWQFARFVELVPVGLLPSTGPEALVVVPEPREVTFRVEECTESIVVVDGVYGVETVKVDAGSTTVTVTVHAATPVVFTKGAQGRASVARPLPPDAGAKGPIDLTSPEPTGCLDLQVATDERSELWLDGVRIEAGPQSVGLGVPHTVTVMHRKAPGEWVVEAEDDLEPLYHSTGCKEIPLDLRSSKGIALTPVAVDDSCGDFGPSGSAVWGDAARFLERNAPRAGLSFRDLNGMAEAARWLEDVRHSLTSLGGEPVGASRGDRATETDVATAAAELWRQGVREVVSLEVQCRRDPRTTGLRLSVVGRALDLETLHASNHDPVTGVELDGLIVVDTEIIPDLDAVEPAVRHLLSRLLDLRYLQFTEFRREVPFAQEIDVVVEYIDPAGGPERALRARPQFDVFAPERSMAEAVCPTLEATGRIAGRPPEDAALGKRLASPRWQERSHSRRTRTYLLRVDPPRPGPVILRATLASPRGPLAEYRCIDVTQAPRMLAGEFAIGALELGSRDERVQRSSLRTSLTVDFSSPLSGKLGLVPLDALHVGVGGGLNLVTRRYDALPAWDGLPTAEDGPNDLVGPDGSASLEWSRYGLVLGPRAALVMRPLCWWGPRCRHSARRLVMTVMLAADLDVGFYDAKGLSTAYTAAQGGLPAADVDIDITGKLLFGYQLAPRQMVSIGVTIWLPGVDDPVIAKFHREHPEARSGPSFDFFPMMGGVLRYGWSL